MSTSSTNILACWWHRYPYFTALVLLSIPSMAVGARVGWLIR